MLDVVDENGCCDDFHSGVRWKLWVVVVVAVVVDDAVAVAGDSDLSEYRVRKRCITQNDSIDWQIDNNCQWFRGWAVVGGDDGVV